jgi:hypothetical protein
VGTARFDGPIIEQIGLEIEGPQFDLLDRNFEPESLRIERFLPAQLFGSIAGSAYA